MATNKFMYVNQQLLTNMQNQSPKVLINPNFVQAAQVKPHFNKQFLKNQTIHFNPKHFVQEQTSNQVVPNRAIVNTKTKLVRLPEHSNVSPSINLKQKIEPPRIRRTSMHTTYKIIRQPTSKNKQSQEVTSKKSFKSAFVVDNRIKSVKTFKSSKSLFFKSKNLYIQSSYKMRKSYKSTNIEKNKFKNKMSKKEQILTIRGLKYKLDSNHRTLTLFSKMGETAKSTFKTVYVGGIVFKRKEPNIFVKVSTNRKYLCPNKLKTFPTSTFTMRKSNLPCPYFRKFGKCNGKENGTCIRVHNPNQISLCPKFLQGCCVNNKCLLSHKVTAEKMPTCKFFLEGLCCKEECSYLHVKINEKVEICKEFLEGFCKKAADCEKRHQYLCPDFERSGTCIKKKCQYPHGNRVRKHKFSKVQFQSKINAEKLKSVMLKEYSDKARVEITNHLENAIENESEMTSNVRYYNESCNNKKEKLDNQNKSENNENQQKDCTLEPTIKKRPRVGDLPSFIPFLDNSI